ncbi:MULTISPECIES: LLM class flavin-dependent oxidoreductase [unclassified Microbacterium]|uniref:LLM class flavin-dependent oxidoreductase n=1 Tax=unclassified Microbacterium TaxID=2609290 RepID=UPI00214C720D|nr:MULTISPECIES: LLM class flavin-dependent oxidoreductase [unclassified Microbacterium]MCR2783437.1 LLM class flavin-dependent oxidoreductase [Microbacterium sp. zg.B96]WIM15695.1 LLM class flavin-dependent oxidoreductase [Microbacterium sp. zg-B96]
MTRPDIGVMLPRNIAPARVREFALRAEALGFDELWVVEDLGFRGGIAQAGAVLAWTERIRVGLGILPAGARNAAFGAMELATLAQLFPGRLHAGIGHGMPEWMRSVGAWTDPPLRTLDTHVTTLRTLLRGDVIAGGVRLDASSVPADPPPLLLGVRGPRSLALSGRIADGTVLAEPVTPEYARAAVERIGVASGHRLVAYNVGSVDADAAAALAAARPALAWIGEPDWAPHIDPLTFAAEFHALRARSASREEFAQALPDEWVAQLALAGTPAQVRARIDELAAAGVHSSVFAPLGDPVAALESLAAVL